MFMHITVAPRGVIRSAATLATVSFGASVSTLG